MSGETTTLDVGESGLEYASACCEVDCATLDVEAARDATNSPIALSTAESAGDNERRKSGQEVHDVLTGLGPHSIEPLQLIGHRTTAPGTLSMVLVVPPGQGPQASQERPPGGNRHGPNPGPWRSKCPGPGLHLACPTKIIAFAQVTRRGKTEAVRVWY
jgi:hypothetical protein